MQLPSDFRSCHLSISVDLANPLIFGLLPPSLPLLLVHFRALAFTAHKISRSYAAAERRGGASSGYGLGLPAELANLTDGCGRHKLKTCAEFYGF